MSETVTVEAVKDARDWESDDGKIKNTYYTLDIKHADGASEEVDHGRKQGTPEPQPGEELEVVFEPGKFRRKMKKAPQQGPGGGGGRLGAASPSGGTGHSGRDDLGARIERQAALKVLSPSINAEETLTPALRRHVEELETFIGEAGQEVKQGAEGSEPSSPSGGPSAPASSPADQGEAIQFLAYKLTGAAVGDYAADELAKFAFEHLDEGRRKSLSNALLDPDTQMAAVKGLRTEYKKARGHEVPEESPDDLPPF